MDSLLAAKIIKNMGIEVIGLHCIFKFDPTNEKEKIDRVKKLLAPHDIPVVIEDTTQAFMEMFLNPDHGYGSEMNPCIDCRLLTLKYAKKLMEKVGAQFVITGEVVGQRPMTQNKPTIFHIDKVSGLRGRILRPLCAMILPPTIPEEEGWVDREKLYDISGRSRKRQIALVKELGIDDYNQPAGGCILTDPQWSQRVKVLLGHRKGEDLTIESVRLLRLGRHFWPNKKLWVIIGRDEKDNRELEKFKSNRWVFHPPDFKGPLVLADGVESMDDKKRIAGMAARYCKKREKIEILYHGFGEEGLLEVEPLDEEEMRQWRV